MRSDRFGSFAVRKPTKMAGTAQSSGTKSVVKIIANIFISFIGAGVLGLPFAFKEAGIIEGIVVMSLVGLISVKAMLLIVDCKYRLIEKQPYRPTKWKKKQMTNGEANGGLVVDVDDAESADELDEFIQVQVNGGIGEEISIPKAGPGKDLTYGDVGYYAVGRAGRAIVEISIVISQVGFCCAYLIFIVENLSDYIQGYHLWEWLFVLLPPLFLLTLIRSLSSLAISSLFAQCSNLLAFGVVFWFDFEHFAHVQIRPKEFSIAGLPFFMAVSIYCYEGAGMILALEASAHKEIRNRFRFFFKTTMVVVTILYISFGMCGYLSFGPETNAIITLNLPKASSVDFASMVKSCLCLALYFTYPVMMFPVIRILEGKCLPDASIRWQGNTLRALVVFVTGMIVMAIPNFANLMAIIGSSCCTLLAFILPGVFHIFIYKGSLTKCQFLVDVVIIAIGVVGSFIGMADALRRLHGYSAHEVRLQNVTSLLDAVTSSTLAPLSDVVTSTLAPLSDVVTSTLAPLFRNSTN